MMTTVKVHAEIAPDGKLRLEIPLGLPAGKAEVVLVVQPDTPRAGESRPAARSGIFARKSGAPLDIDASLGEMNDTWKSKLTDLK